VPPAPNASSSPAGAAAAAAQLLQPSLTSGKPPTSRASVVSPCAPTPAPAVVLPKTVSHVASPAALPQPQLAFDEGKVLADVNGSPSPRVHPLRNARAKRAPSAWRRPSLEPLASRCDRPRLQPGLPCTFALSRSTPSYAGVSGINRDTCQASAEALTGILRDAFVVHQPNQHTDFVPARGLEPRTLGLKDRCSNQAELRRRIQIVAWGACHLLDVLPRCCPLERVSKASSRSPAPAAMTTESSEQPQLG
jgi:hypothetical protein